MGSPDPKEIVRRGYDKISTRYRADNPEDGDYGPWLQRLLGVLPSPSSVLDMGCGCGVPVARGLVAAGIAVTGVDISDVQIQRARKLVPAGTFLRADAVDVDFPAESFDAVVCLYALIHMPLADQQLLLARMGHWLRPGGWLLATAGHHAWTGTEDNWLGGSAPMWWSLADAETYRGWIRAAGFEIQAEDFVPEGSGGHTLFWARRPTP